MLRTLLFSAAAVLTANSLAKPSIAASGCVADWSTAAQIVEKERLLTVEQVSAANAGAIPGKIVKTTLCREKDGFVYRLVVRNPAGQLQIIVVDAQNYAPPPRQNPVPSAIKR